MVEKTSEGVLRPAIFLDRDGVINHLVFNPTNSEYESPHWPEDFSVYTYVIPALKNLMKFGYLLFLISNQPSYAKGKTSMDNILAIQQSLEQQLLTEGVSIQEYYYCYHHPLAVVPELAVICECRKPGTKFISEAVGKFGVDLHTSYFIGDQDSDIECGQQAKMKTIMVDNEFSLHKRGKSSPDFVVKDLYEATELIGKIEGWSRANE